MTRPRSARGNERLGRLVKLLEKKVQGSKPQLLCAEKLRDDLPTTRDISMK